MIHTHPLRTALHDEVHARPRPAVPAPTAVAHASVLRQPQGHQGVPEALMAWCARCQVAPPATAVSHFEAEYGQLRLKWEQHAEFEDYTVYVPGLDPVQPFAPNAADAVLEALLAHDLRPVIAALRIAVLRPAPPGPTETDIATLLATSSLVGATLSEGQATLYSSFQLDGHGFGRFLLLDHQASPNQLGRHVQRIIEMEVYRMMAMLAFPEARAMARELDQIEQHLSALVARLDVAPPEEEPQMLHEINRLAGLAEQLATAGAFRFGAARAYRDLVAQRGEELREQRLAGLQTPTGFLRRRFQPAMAFCDAVARRLDSIAERIARASALLRTRVEIEHERQNQALLETMNRRAELQWHLQQTVEGLSVAAIAYYAVGLVSYGFKALAHAGVGLDPELATGLALLPVVLIVALGVRSIRRRVVTPHAAD